MRENVFDDETEETESEDSKETPESKKEDDRIAAMEKQLEQMVGGVSNLTQSLREAMQSNPVPVDTRAGRQPAPQPAPPEKPKPKSKEENEALLDELARDPEGFINKYAKEAAQGLAQAEYDPLITQLIGSVSEAHLLNEAEAFDRDFGAGAWKEVVEPVLKPDLDRLREHNPRALVSKETVRALVDRVKGQKLTDLVERKEATMGKKQEPAGGKTGEPGGEVSGLPGGQSPRLRGEGGPGRLPPDAEQFLQEIEKATGQKQDRKTFSKLYGTGGTLDDFVKATSKERAA